MWATLGNPGQAGVDLTAAANADGRVEVFLLTASQQIWHNWQVVPGGAWAGWSPLGTGADTATSLAVGQNADGRLEVFRIAPNGDVLHTWQVTPNGGWSAWAAVTNPEAASRLVVARNLDGRLEICIAPTAATSNVWHAWQTAPNAGWSAWATLGDPPGSAISSLAAGQNMDGRLEVFAGTPNGGIWHIWQNTPNADWSAWALLSAADATCLDLALGHNVDGRLEVFAISATNAISHAWQVAANGAWSDWGPLPNGDRTGVRIAVGRNADCRLETVLVDVGNTSMHNWQITAGGAWSGWQPLDTQTVSTGLVVTQNVDGRLEVFGAAPTGDVVHTWQLSANQWQWPGTDFATSPQLNPSQASGLLLTQHVDSARSGWNPFETALNVTTVPHVKSLFTQPLDGPAYAQPLYVAGVTLPDGSVHNAGFVATENDTVYAFDADTPQPALWTRSLIPTGESTVPTADIEGCTNITPTIGITSTPVIADSTNTLYVVAKTKRLADASYHHYLFALDVTTGADRPSSPAEISASCLGVSPLSDGHQNILFLPQWQLNRPGLLLMNGVVYIAFGSHCDLHQATYHGWVVGYDAVTLAQVGAFCATPNDVVPVGPNQLGGAAGIWQAGIGLATDSTGAVYCCTGNGAFDSAGRNYGDTVLKLGRDLKLLDFFTPADQPDLFLADLDLGSGAALVLPSQTGGPAELLTACGKDGDLFVLNRQGLGGYTGPGGNNPQAVQVVPLQPALPKGTEIGVFGSGAYCHLVDPAGTSDSQFMYYCGVDGPLTAFVLGDGLLVRRTQSTDSYTGGTPTVSSNGTLPQSGVVWMIPRQSPLRLLAFDANDLTHKLLDIDAGPWTNAGGGPFLEPTVVNGKVYVGSDGQLGVFGL